jgi:hypothetical protein
MIQSVYPFSEMAASAMAAFINRHDDAIVFGVNSALFYRVLPRLARSIHAVDLVDDDSAGLEVECLRLVDRIDRRLVRGDLVAAKLDRQYREHRVPTACQGRIRRIAADETADWRALVFDRSR